MIELTAAQVAAATGGRLQADPDVTVTGAVIIDSRSAAPGALFVALPGERVDGHDFAAAAVEAGAALVLASVSWTACRPSSWTTRRPPSAISRGTSWRRFATVPTVASGPRSWP